MRAARADRLVVAVLTFRRPELLGKLLQELPAHACEARRDFGLAVEILVVDNDPAASAREVVLRSGLTSDTAGSAGASQRSQRGAAAGLVRYVQERAPGIAPARNRALTESGAADLLVFIDDDEVPEPGWLRALLAAHREHGSAAVAGRVISRFEAPLDPWLAAGGFFARAHRSGVPTGRSVRSAASNNLLLDLRVLRAHSLRFNDALGAAGGEDTELTLRLTAAGERIVWCNEAVVVDLVPAERATRRAALRRVYALESGSAAATVAAASGQGWRGRARAAGRALGVGAIRVGHGLVQAAAGYAAGRVAWQSAGARRCARGAGSIAGALGFRYAEYARSRPPMASTHISQGE